MPRVKNMKPDYAALVNQLAVLNKRASDIEEKSKAIKEQLKASGLEKIETNRYRCVIVHVPAGEKLDTKLVRQYLTTEQLIECTKYTDPQTRVNLYDR